MFIVNAYCYQGDEVAEVRAYAFFSTVTEAENFAASLPKSLNVKVSFCGDKGIVNFHVKLKSDAVNGGKNEVGLKRLRSFLSRVEFNYEINASNSATEQQFNDLLS